MTITQINQTHYNAYQSYMLLDFEFSFQKEYQKQKNDDIANIKVTKNVGYKFTNIGKFISA